MKHRLTGYGVVLLALVLCAVLPAEPPKPEQEETVFVEGQFLVPPGLIALVPAAAHFRGPEYSTRFPSDDWASPVALPKGLPTSWEERQLYDRHPDTGEFTKVPVGQEIGKRAYVRWHAPRQMWVWCTGSDLRMILPGSKMQGARLGLPGKRGDNWFYLDPPGNNWRKVTDRKVPEIFREDTRHGKVLSERCPEEWIAWGGELDPLPGRTPASCTLVAEPTEAAPGEKIKVSIEASGDVEIMDIDGRWLTPPRGWVTYAPDRVGEYRSNGTVRGPGGTRHCRASFRIKATPTRPPTCTLTASPQTVATGGKTRLRMKTEGRVTKAEIEGEEVEFPEGEKMFTPSGTGSVEVTGRVTGPGGSNTCTTEVIVEKKPDVPPKCFLTVTPTRVKLGEKVQVSMEVLGQVQKAKIQDQEVTLPGAKIEFQTKAAGITNVKGSVEGPGGTASCEAVYYVEAPAEKPTCEMKVEPSPGIVGQDLKLILTAKGQVTEAEIEGQPVTFPTGERKIRPMSAGTFAAAGAVRGPGGLGVCRVEYRVDRPPTDPAPTCSLVADPPEIPLGGTIVLTLTTVGTATSADIDGQQVSFPKGERRITPLQKGSLASLGTVTGPGGTRTCRVEYQVKEPKDPPPQCKITTTPKVVKLGKTVEVKIEVASGNATRMLIDGSPVDLPVGTKTYPTSVVGKFTVKGRIIGPSGESECVGDYTVDNAIEEAPTCRITVSPTTVKTGDPVELRMDTTGHVSRAILDGEVVDFPVGKRILTPKAAGSFMARGRVSGPGGTNDCMAPYTVEVKPELPPTCRLDATPNPVKQGATVVVTMTTTNTVVEATIDGQKVTSPTGTRNYPTSALGKVKVSGKVLGPGGANVCETEFTVVKDEPVGAKPGCEITAQPVSVKLGQNVVLTMTTTGDVTSATLDGSGVDFPSVKRMVTPKAVGPQFALGEVKGPGGTSTCWTKYDVTAP